jgi:hypothetical protein
MARNTEKHEKWEILTVGIVVWQKSENHGKWETHKVGRETWRKTQKVWQMTKEHCRIWIQARQLKNVENETETLFDLEYGEKQ